MAARELWEAHMAGEAIRAFNARIGSGKFAAGEVHPLQQIAWIPAGYAHRTGMADRSAFTFVETPSDIAQDVSMIERFAEIATSGDPRAFAASSEASQKSQTYLDAVWAACHRR